MSRSLVSGILAWASLAGAPIGIPPAVVPGPVTVTGVSPASGSVTGGQAVTVTGTGFVAGQTIIRINGLPATAVLVSGPTSLTCVTPASQVIGAVDVAALNPGGYVYDLAAAFTYVAPKTLVSIAVTPANATIGTQHTLQYTAIGTYSDSTTADLTSTALWSAVNPAVATGAHGGLVTGVGVGNSTVIAFDQASGVYGATPVTVIFAVPAGAILSFDAMSLSSVTRYVYGAAGTPDGQYMTALADISSTGATATQGTLANVPLYDEFALAGNRCVVWGGNGGHSSWPVSTTGMAISSFPLQVPYTIFGVWRLDNLGTLFEFSADVTNAHGVKVANTQTAAVTNGPAGTQTSTGTVADTPATIFGSALGYWQRSDQGVTQAGGKVSNYADISGHSPAMDLSQGGSNKLSYSASGGVMNLPYLSDAGGTTDSLTGASIGWTGTQKYDLFNVVVPVAYGGSNTFLSDYGGDNKALLLTPSGGGQIFADDAGNAFAVVGNPFLTDQYGDTGICAIGVNDWYYNTNVRPTATLGAQTLGNKGDGSASSAAAQHYERFGVLGGATPTQILRTIRYFYSRYVGSWGDNVAREIVVMNDGTTTTFSVDGVALTITSVGGSGTGAIPTIGTLGAGHGLANAVVGAMGCTHVYPRIWSGADLAAGTAYKQANWPSAPVTDTQTLALEGFGDSTMFGAEVNGPNGGGDPRYTLLGCIRKYRGAKYGRPNNRGISGTRLVSGGSSINSQILATILRTDIPNVLIVLGGINDIGNETAAQIIADWQTVLASTASICTTSGQANHAFVCTITSVGVDQVTVNAWLRANYAVATNANASFHLLDLAADTVLTGPGGVAASPYNGNGVHQSALGYEREYGLLKPQLDALGL